jgi:ABC-type lipoprotein release transport system permease subunit
VLKTLGMLPRQVRSAVSWQATTIVMAGIIIGLPLGIAAGRSVWALVAEDLGVIVRPVVPWQWVVALVPLAILTAIAVAVGPGLAAARIKPAEVLRAE